MPAPASRQAVLAECCDTESWLRFLDQVADQRGLFLDQLSDPKIGEVEQLEQGVAAERDGLRRALYFDEPAVAGFDDVHVDVGLAVVLVGEVEQRLAADDTDA